MKQLCKLLVTIICVIAFFGTATVCTLAESPDYTTVCSIMAKNELTGSIAQDSDESFIFKISPVDNAPMPDKDVLEIKGAGEGTFDPIIYTKPGIYVYTVTSEAGTNTNINYDTTSYRVTVVAKNISGNPNNGLTASVVAVEDISAGAKTDDGLLYKSVCYYVTGSIPQTGDNGYVVMYSIIFGIAFVLIAVLIIISVVRRNRKKNSATKNDNGNIFEP